jgi:hypothetical protein
MDKLSLMDSSCKLVSIYTISFVISLCLILLIGKHLVWHGLKLVRVGSKHLLICFVSYLALSIGVSRTYHNFIYISQKPYECDDDIWDYQHTYESAAVSQIKKKWMRVPKGKADLLSLCRSPSLATSPLPQQGTAVDVSPRRALAVIVTVCT